jgi:hypothetical protein
MKRTKTIVPRKGKKVRETCRGLGTEKRTRDRGQEKGT